MLGLFSFFLMFFLGEGWGDRALFIGMGANFFIAQYFLSRGHRNELPVDCMEAHFRHLNSRNIIRHLVACLPLAVIAFASQNACRAAPASLLIYDLSTGRQVRALAGHNRPTTAVAVSPDGSLALSASLTPELRLWSLQTGREIRSISPPQSPNYIGPACSLQFVNGTNLVLIGHKYGGVRLWNIESNALVLDFKAPFKGTASALISSDQQTVLAISSSEVQIVAWGFAKGDLRGAFAEEWLEQYQPTQVSYVSLTRDGKSRSWWEAESGKPWPEARPIPAGTHSGFLDDAVLSPDGRLVVTYGVALGDFRWLRVWNIESGKLLQHHPGLDLPMVPVFRPSQSCAAIAFSPDSRALAIGRRREGLAIHEVEGRRLRQELKTPAGSCALIAFVPDGKQLLTWGDKTMRVWELGTGKMLRSFNVPTVNCWALTPDGRFVVVGGDGEFRGL